MPTNVSTTIAQGNPNTAALNLVNGDTVNLFPTGFILAGGTSTSPGVLASRQQRVQYLRQHLFRLLS